MRGYTVKKLNFLSKILFIVLGVSFAAPLCAMRGGFSPRDIESARQASLLQQEERDTLKALENSLFNVENRSRNTISMDEFYVNKTELDNLDRLERMKNKNKGDFFVAITRVLRSYGFKEISNCMKSFYGFIAPSISEIEALREKFINTGEKAVLEKIIKLTEDFLKLQNFTKKRDRQQIVTNKPPKTFSTSRVEQILAANGKKLSDLIIGRIYNLRVGGKVVFVRRISNKVTAIAIPHSYASNKGGRCGEESVGYLDPLSFVENGVDLVKFITSNPMVQKIDKVEKDLIGIRRNLTRDVGSFLDPFGTGKIESKEHRDILNEYKSFAGQQTMLTPEEIEKLKSCSEKYLSRKNMVLQPVNSSVDLIWDTDSDKRVYRTTSLPNKYDMKKEKIFIDSANRLKKREVDTEVFIRNTAVSGTGHWYAMSAELTSDGGLGFIMVGKDGFLKTPCYINFFKGYGEMVLGPEKNRKNGTFEASSVNFRRNIIRM